MQFFYLMFLLEVGTYLQLYYNYYDIVIFSMGYRRVLPGIILAIAIIYAATTTGVISALTRES